MTDVPGTGIVVGVDETEQSLTAVDAAAGFAFAEAALRGCAIDAVHAWSHPVSRGPGDMQPLVFDPILVQAEEERMVAEALAGWCEKHPDVALRRRLVRAHARQALVEAGSDASMSLVTRRPAPADGRPRRVSDPEDRPEDPGPAGTPMSR